MKKIKISAVSYLNTYPFLYGISTNKKLQNMVEISTDYPSICAKKLKNNKVDIGLVPIAILPELADYKIISDFCIATNDEVKSVLLVSDVPLEKIDTILLDYQSRTSIMLAKILANNFWKISPKWINAENNYVKLISKHTAGVVIGDRALNVLTNYKYVYDLASEWNKYTKLPFVFATWTANKFISKDIILEFNNALAYGVENIEKTIEYFSENVAKINFNSYEYLTKYIDYKLDAEKQKAIETYLKFMNTISSIAL